MYAVPGIPRNNYVCCPRNSRRLKASFKAFYREVKASTPSSDLPWRRKKNPDLHFCSAWRRSESKIVAELRHYLYY
jgi:hypothetical protein